MGIKQAKNKLARLRAEYGHDMADVAREVSNSGQLMLATAEERYHVFLSSCRKSGIRLTGDMIVGTTEKRGLRDLALPYFEERVAPRRMANQVYVPGFKKGHRQQLLADEMTKPD